MSSLILTIGTFGMVFFGVWWVCSLFDMPVSPKGRPIPWAGVLAVVCYLLAPSRPPFVNPVNSRALFEESRAGVTRGDVRDHLQTVESRVPDVLRDIESRLPRASADLEREMMRHAGEYGISPADIRAQVREIEAESRRQIRGMDEDVRRQIRDMEPQVWDELGRIESGY